MADLEGKRIAFLAAPEGTEEVELTAPWQAVVDAGGTPELVSTTPEDVQAFNHLDKASSFPVDHVASAELVERYDALVLPGGVANPDVLRTSPAAVAFTKGFFEAGKPVGAICHAAWTLVEAGVVDQRELTSWPSLATDLTNAGASWIDQEVVVDASGPNVLVTSREPGDLDAFCATITDVFSGNAASPTEAATLAGIS